MRKFLIAAAACSFAFASEKAALAQDQGNGGGASPGGGGGNQGGAVQTSPTTVITTVPTYPGAVAPPPPGTPIGGGNVLESNHFSLDTNTGNANTIHGSANGAGDFGAGRPSYTMGQGGAFSGVVPDSYTVKHGDTLWAICDTYFQNPYQWPRIWSYNPQIQNPHWIYPGDQVKLHEGGPRRRRRTAAGSPCKTKAGASSIGAGQVVRRRSSCATRASSGRRQGRLGRDHRRRRGQDVPHRHRRGVHARRARTTT